jgi:hypothetical protein
MTDLLHRLVYRSTLAIQGTEENVLAELDRILATSRENNARHALTGVLVHSGGTIMQVLEGPREALEQTYDRISADTRHTAFDLVQFVPVTKREFAAWSMAYATPPQLDRFWTDGVVNAAAAPEEINAALRAIGMALDRPDADPPMADNEHDPAPATARAA